MTCPHCQAPNPLAARYCQQCGRAFGPPCPHCGAATWPQAHYCTECGTALAAAGAAPAAAPDGIAVEVPLLAEERRLVTALFADVVGFTPLSERLDPEEVRDLMLDTFREFARIVREHGGRIEKYIGDALFGLFGAPVSREDDAERALRCALALHAAAAQRSAELELPSEQALRLRIGVNTGLAVVGAVGDGHEYGAMGDTINTAARLQSAADPGGTLAGEATWRTTQHALSFGAPRLLQLKGKAAPTLGYPLLGPRATVLPASPTAPLIGREAESATLATWLDAVASGHGRIGMITGETGIGKSRLLAEARARAERLGLYWVSAQGHAHTQNVPGSVFDDAAYTLLGLPPRAEMPPDQLDRLLRERMAALHSEAAYPFVATRLGLPVDRQWLAELKALPPAAAQARAATAIEGMFAALAAERPMVLALDDAHWADPSSLAAQERLLGLTERVPLGLLYVLRADVGDAYTRLRERAVAELPHRYTELALGPLSREGSLRLLTQLLGGPLTPRAADVVLERAGGHPLYLEEITRSLVDEGTLVATPDGWCLAEDREAYLPTTLHATLLARLDHLSEPTRHVLQAASVLGRQFSLPVLARIVPEAYDVEAGLLEAQRAGLLEALGTGPARGYQFRHGLVQEAAYDTLLLRHRRELHRAAAEALRATTADGETGTVESLAYHYAHAEAWPEAQAAASAAATRAEAEHAYREAATHWQAAGRAAAARGSEVPPGERGELATRHGDALAHLGELAPAQAVYESAVAAWMEEPPAARRTARALLHVRLGRMLLLQGDANGASAALQVAIPGLAADDPTLSSALSLEAQACLQRGQLAAAVSWARRALELARRVGGPAEEGDAYAALVNPALAGELGARSEAYSREWVALAREQGDPTELVRALASRIGLVASLVGVADAALQADADEQLAVALELRAPRFIRMAHSSLGLVLLLRGDWDGAAREMASGLGARPEDTGLAADFNRWALGWLHTMRGEYAVGRGWYEEGLRRTRFDHAPIWVEAGLAQNRELAGDAAGARGALARAAAALARNHCPACGVVYHAIAAETHASLGDAAAARTSAAEAQRLGRTLGRVPARLAAHRALAQLALDAGEAAAAVAELRPALRQARQIEHPFERARTELLAGRALSARGGRADRTQARALLTAALATFEHLGTHAYADACRTALAAVAAPPPRRLSRPTRTKLVRAG